MLKRFLSDTAEMAPTKWLCWAFAECVLSSPADTAGSLAAGPPLV